MKAYVITINGDKNSENGFKQVLKTSKAVGNDSIEFEKYKAIIPEDVEETMYQFNVKWTWPIDKPRYDCLSGMSLHPYKTKDIRLKYACSMSHYLLWAVCSTSEQPILIMEHDAIWLKRLDPQILYEADPEIIGINSPKQCTRRWQRFEDEVSKNDFEVQPVPTIDNEIVPQGLAGGSAYYITPYGAERAMHLVKKHGLWPNDALLCRQFFGNDIGVTREWYTWVDMSMKSSTT